MKKIYADLHIHIGRTFTGRAVKITGAKTLTLDRILVEASEHKGIELLGIIDCHSPEVILELEEGISSGKYRELDGGGIRYRSTTLLLGSELEIYDEACSGPIHVLVFMPTLAAMKQFSNWLSARLKNIHLSSQRIYETGLNLQKKVQDMGGLFIPAHIFTPHKSLYGKGVKSSLTEVFVPSMIDAVELGLSCDTDMASHVSQLNPYPFLTNSDAHSLGKIGREYNELYVQSADFTEFALALKGQDDRKIIANYGLDPLLGKYYQTACEACGEPAVSGETACANCGNARFTKGVSERLRELSDQLEDRVPRPRYVHQIPLQFVPGVGPKTLDKLKKAFGTEMAVLHEAAEEDLARVVPPKTAALIVKARSGKLELKAGGGGTYGKIKP
ncbi:TIGR00375 family protein [Bacillus subtilis]|uniref:TIGR00375 family protein n=1 Tax=Bacillus subtilis TaxID=1423 RepID=UPI00100A1104|nr:TIGR00375 family protein [Bacillus subtilis]MDK7655665.1 TIGR00375 family protein [Bacillus subtilis]MEC0319805.1 TIGR00375 family protein [Bacillus subtilis]MEC2234889.1 TIGR00375 family protein [Bacillus subtilis]MED4863043.1 TIGR00375 family protein [Bacillus subtilis]QAW33693.1 TIGR00375 family protein [Bacillus subtilis]